MSEIGHNGGPVIEARAGNWIAISRDLIEHHIVGAGRRVYPADKNEDICFNRMEAWIDLLSMANFAERRIDIRGTTLILAPGQTLAGRAYLAKRWNWTEKTVRGFLERLQRELMISLACEALKTGVAQNADREETGQKTGHVRGHLPNVLSICNWSKYQGSDTNQGPDAGPSKGQPRASQGPHYNKVTTKQDNTPLPPKGGRSSYRDLARQAFDEFADLAARCRLPRPTTLTDVRSKAIIARMIEHAGDDATPDAMLAVWRKALVNIERSKFLRGMTDRPFRADLTFVCQAKSFTRLIEGGYGNGAHVASSFAREDDFVPDAPAIADAWDEVRRQRAEAGDD